MSDNNNKKRRIVHLDEQVDKVATVPHKLFDRVARALGVGGALEHDLKEEHSEDDGCRRINFKMVKIDKPEIVVFEYLIIEKFEHFINDLIDPTDFVVLDIMEDGIAGKPQTRIAEGFKYLDEIRHDRRRRYYFSAFPSFLPEGLIDTLNGCEKHDTPALLNELMAYLNLRF